MSRRRRGDGGQLVTIYWRDIPAQVTASRARETEKALLTDRFQHAIDRAAGVAGLTDTNSYVNEWRREARASAGEPAAEAAAEAARLETAYPRDRLEELVRNGGLEPAIPSSVASDSPTSVANDSPNTAASGDRTDPVGGHQ